jgi:hypothetical protein
VEDVIGALQTQGIEAERRAGTLIAGRTYVDVVRDDRLGAGFTWGRNGPLPGDLTIAVGACTHAALVQVAQRLDAAVQHLACLGRALQAAGGIAVRMEGSGSASAWQPWLDRLDSGSLAQVYSASVIIVEDGDTFFTCGMQQFDLPDAEIAVSDASTAIEWLDSLSIFQLEEQPALGSGHTFRPDSEKQRRTIERWPDHRHHPDDGRYNPYGLWRLLPEGVKGLEAVDPVPTLVPSLVATLTASERSNGGPLTQLQVELIVEQAPAIAMPTAVALAFERERGYADIEPRRAWEQWQIVREHL